jgi:hypothetical protein
LGALSRFVHSGFTEAAVDENVEILVAAENGCWLLLSENLPDGFSWHGVTVVNLFAGSLRHPLLEAFIVSGAER